MDIHHPHTTAGYRQVTSDTFNGEVISVEGVSQTTVTLFPLLRRTELDPTEYEVSLRHETILCVHLQQLLSVGAAEALHRCPPGSSLLDKVLNRGTNLQPNCPIQQEKERGVKRVGGG